MLAGTCSPAALTELGIDLEQCQAFNGQVIDAYTDGLVECSPCDDGNTSPGGTAATQCTAVTCNAGQFVDGNGCSDCPQNTIPNPSNATECQQCPDGTTTIQSGGTFCIPTCVTYTCSPGFVAEASKQNELCRRNIGCSDELCCVPEQIKGCTDKDAINFESDATEDDGTCIFLHVAKAGGGSKVYGKGPHSQVTSGNGAFALKNKRSGTDLSISNSATWASSGLFGEAAGDSGAEAMTGVPQTSVAKSYSDAIMANFDYNPVGKANSFFSGQGTSKRSPIEIASGADVSIVTPHFAGSSSGIFAGVSKSDPSLQATYADVLSRGGGALKYTAIDVGRPSFDHLHG